MSITLAEAISSPDIRTVAIVGCSKNSGKTTTLNHLLAGLVPERGPCGLLSIGIDGEEHDFWLGVPKPRILVRPGYLIATAERLIRGGTARARVLDRMGVLTPLGEMVLARVEDEGVVVLAGVRHKGDVRRLIEAMFRHRAARVFIDGSYQRLMAADPDISQGVILATGAILGRTVRDVVRRTRDVLERLLLPEATDPTDRALLDDALRHGRPTTRDASGRIVVLAQPGLTVSEPEVRKALGQGDVVVAAPGVVSDRLLRTLLGHRTGKVRIVLADPTRLFVSPPVYRRFRARGGEVRVARTVNLLAIAVSPTSVLGRELPGEALRGAIQEIVPGLPVVVVRESSPSG